MQTLFSRLLDLLRHELGLYHQLLDILYQERQVLIDRRIPELSGFVRQEEKIIYQIEQAEYARDDLLTQLLSYPEFDSKPLNASTLIDFAEEPLKSEYIGLFDQVKQVKTEFEYVNQTNQQLIQSERDYVHFLMEQVTKMNEPGDTYVDDGNLREPVSRGLFDRRI